MTKMLFNMKIIFTIAFIAVIWLLPEKGNAQKTESPEAVFSKAVEAVLVNSCSVYINIFVLCEIS